MTKKKKIPIEREKAIELCEIIRSENKKKKISMWKAMCYFCAKAAGDDITHRCICANEENRGCTQVNKRYDNMIA